MKIVVVDPAEEDEIENERVPERTADLLDRAHDHVLRQYLGHDQQDPIRVLPLIIPGNAGGSEDPNAVAENRNEETSTRKMDFQRISGQFLSPSWS